MTDYATDETDKKVRDWWSTEIIDMKPGEIRYRGYAIEELIGNIGLAQMVWLMLRGDLPSGIGRARFTHNAEILVGWIRDHSADHFHLEVAAYPETHPDAKSPAADLAAFKSKVDAGANSAITQYFYNPNAYYDFIERCGDWPVSMTVLATRGSTSRSSA